MITAEATHETHEDADERTAPPAPPVVTVRQGRNGAVLTDSAGYTLYVFSGDVPQASHCIGECARRWRPAVSQGVKPHAGEGAPADAVGSIRRPDGSYQITFNGRPLYYFTGDTTAGAENGSGRDEFGGHWSSQPPVDTD